MREPSLFDFPQFKINKKIRLIELFGGIGTQAMALRDIGADFEHYRLVEFDKYAVQSYNAVHGTRYTVHDIREIHAKDLGVVDKDKYCYLMTYSFPCTDLSVAGKMQGMSKSDWETGQGTRSGLLWEVERILKEMSDEELPDVLLMENVPQVHAEQNREDFENWLSFLKSKKYKNFWQDLNAKDYCIPQNRDRCFCVRFLSDDDFMEFNFPEPVKLEKVMKDYLEDEVDEKYYINNDKADKLIKQLIESGVLPTEQNRTEQRTDCRITCQVSGMANDNPKYQPNCQLGDIAATICAREYKGPANFSRMNGAIEKQSICVLKTRKESQSQTVSKQDMTQEYQTYKQMEVE